LLGITRETVLAIAQERGLEVKFQPLDRDSLAAVNEAFNTSSSRGIVPVIQIDTLQIGQGRPGAITKELMAAYEAYVRLNAETIV
jgi:branched-chain amino acid aminotransferase